MKLLKHLICCLFKIWMKNDKMAVCFVTNAHARGCFGGQAADWITPTRWEEPHQEVE